MGPQIPYSLLYSLPNNSFVRVLDSNDYLVERMRYLAMPQVQFHDYQVLEDTPYPARVKLLLPPGYRKEEQYTFPLVVRV